MRIRDTKNLGALVLLLLLGACAQNPPAPVQDMTSVIPPAGASSNERQVSEAAQTRSGHYTVAQGDTLYSIAFHNQLDWKALAQWNGIAAPYTIVPGQDLRLTRPPASQAGAVTTYGTGTSPAADKPVSTKPIATAPAPEPAPAPNTPAAPVVAAPKTPPPVEPIPSVPKSDTVVASGPSRQVAGLRWHWPADGPLLGNYVASDPTRQGIDIGGRRGSPVRAAADGVVVYSGSGLVGYGELVIVKHSDVYLSAYGHNQKRLVKEGEKVKAGQQIATMGSSGTSRTELHFEIRKHGQPIDPMGFLPKK